MDNIAFKTDLLRGAKGEKGDAGSTESVPTDGVLAYVGETTPQGYEEIQVDDVFTDIYANIEDVKEMISDAYDPTATYAVGDYCIYNNALYRCKTAIATPEAFTPAKWTATNVANEINKIKVIRTTLNSDVNGYSSLSGVGITDLNCIYASAVCVDNSCRPFTWLSEVYRGWWVTLYDVGAWTKKSNSTADVIIYAIMK